jgi:hypothetical protein
MGENKLKKPADEIKGSGISADLTFVWLLTEDDAENNKNTNNLNILQKECVWDQKNL